jgi:hypothetical protein
VQVGASKSLQPCEVWQYLIRDVDNLVAHGVKKFKGFCEDLVCAFRVAILDITYKNTEVNFCIVTSILIWHVGVSVFFKTQNKHFS